MTTSALPSLVSGSTAVVGASNHTVGSNGQQGEAYVFVESGGTWSQQAGADSRPTARQLTLSATPSRSAAARPRWGP
jgi:hypothetical protein